MLSASDQRPVAGEQSSARRPSRFSGLGFRSVNGLAAILVLVLIVLPMLALLIQAFWPNVFSVTPNWQFSLEGFASIFGSPYTFRAVFDSFGLAIFTAIVATIMGGGVAFLLEWVTIPGQGFFNGFLWLVLLSPSFLIGDGWQFLIGPSGVFGTGALGHLLLSPLGVSMVLALKLFPYATVAISGPLRGIGQDLFYAARLSGASSFRAFRRVVLPLLIPAAAAGALIVLAEVLSDYGVASTLAQSANFPLMTYSIYAAMSIFPVDFAQAAAMSVILVALVSISQWVERRVVAKRGYVTRVAGSKSLAKQPTRHPWLWVILLSLLFVVALLLPASGIVLESVEKSLTGIQGGFHVTFAYYRGLIHANYALGGLVRSLIYAVAAATIGLGAGIVVSIAWWRQGGWLVSALKVLMTTTIAIPGIVLGAGYIFFWNQPFFSNVGLNVYGTPVILMLGYLGGSLPYAVRVASGSMVQIPPNAIFAARLSGAGLTRIIRKVFVPMMRDTWFRVWLIIFAGVVFELPVSQLLYPPGGPTLAVSIAHQTVNNANVQTGAALTVVSSLVISLIVMTFVVIQRRGQRAPAAEGTAGSAGL